MATAKTLSRNDSRVLSALFDPEASTSHSTTKTDAYLLPGFRDDECKALQAECTLILADLNPRDPTGPQIDQALLRLSSIIERHPRYAPAFIDRAQVRRLSLNTSQLFTEAFSRQTKDVLEDLNSGISLASPSQPSDPVSALQSRVLGQAHAHRGLLLLKLADLRRKNEGNFGVGKELSALDADEVEAVANGDFVVGANYGNAMARDMNVRTNPYAKMCGAIVKEAMRKEIEEAKGVGE